MAGIAINATAEGRLTTPDGAPWETRLAAALGALPAGAPVCVLVHGFRYTWRREVCACACPHDRLYGDAPVPPSARRRPERAAWARDLGLAGAALAVGFAWEARLGRFGRRGFAEVHARAARAGAALARLLARLADLRPDLRVDAFTHSLGARVALAAGIAAPGLPFRRLVLAGAAAHADEAAGFLEAAGKPGARPEVIHLLSRANDAYDAVFARITPRAARRGPPLGLAGLGRAAPDWLDLQIDHPATARWLAERGMAPERARERVSHWTFYADPGVMAFCRAVLARRDAAIPALRAAGIPEEIEPRWARFRPRRLPAPVGEIAGPELAAARQARFTEV